jgi:ATP-dependent Lon protease
MTTSKELTQNVGRHFHALSALEHQCSQRVIRSSLLKERGKIRLKPLTRWNEAYKEFPRYVMEYLCARFVDPTDPLPGQQKIDRILEEHYVESGKKELIKSHIREQGEYTFLGQLSLSYDQRTDHYWADVPALGDSHVRVSERVKREFGDILLTTGAWGTMRIEFDSTYELQRKKYPFYIVEFTPFQVIRLSL